MVDTAWHYVDASGVACGPLSTAEIVACVLEHEVSNETLIRASDGPLKYRPLKTFRELRNAIDAALNATVESAVEPASSASAERVEPAVVSTADNSWYYVDDGDCERGPLTLKRMRELIDDGFIFTPRLVRLGTVTKDVALWPELLVETLDASEDDKTAQNNGQQSEVTIDDAAGGSWEVDEAEWIFIDDDGAVQGPFVTSEMRSWIAEGLLEASRLVNLAGGEAHEFQPISQWAELAVAASASPISETPADVGADARDDVSGQSQPDVQPAVPKASSTSGEASNANDGDGWFFIDDSGVEQGPFMLAKMRGWLKRGFLNSDRMMRSSDPGATMRPAAEWPQLTDALTSAAAATPATASASVGSSPREEAAKAANAHEGKSATASWSSSSGAAAPVSSVHVDGDGDYDEAAASALWEYCDDRGRPQGPFTARKLLKWLRGGHLKSDRRARPYVDERGATGEANGTPFAPLSDAPFFRCALANGAVPAPPPAVPSLGGGAGQGTVETPVWYFVDVSGREQGPFAQTQMNLWVAHGHLPPDTLVRHLSEPLERRRKIGEVPMLGGGGRAPVASAASTAAAGAAAHAPYGAEQPPGGVSGNGAQTQLPAYTTHYREYAVLGGFSMTGSRSGKFVAPEMSGEKYFEAKGIPKHRDERQMGHYFDFNEWQEQMNARKAMQGRGGGATGSKRLRGGKK